MNCKVCEELKIYADMLEGPEGDMWCVDCVNEYLEENSDI